jgi:enterochelin esterase-like enzyme
MIHILYNQFAKVRDVRTGKNTQYEMSDAIMGAFAIFHMQSPSFLNGQKQLQEKLEQNNAETLYEIRQIPTDTHIRNLLDPLDPKEIMGCFKEIIDRLATNGYLDEMRGYDEKLLIAVDGSQYHESHKISCAKCNTRVKDDKIDYYHVILAPAIVQRIRRKYFQSNQSFGTARWT